MFFDFTFSENYYYTESIIFEEQPPRNHVGSMMTVVLAMRNAGNSRKSLKGKFYFIVQSGLAAPTTNFIEQ